MMMLGEESTVQAWQVPGGLLLELDRRGVLGLGAGITLETASSVGCEQLSQHARCTQLWNIWAHTYMARLLADLAWQKFWAKLSFLVVRNTNTTQVHG